MIFLKANAGLCNKLLAIASGLHLANDLGTRLHVLWATDMHMQNLFTELFEPVSVFTLHQIRVPSSRFCRAVANRVLPWVFDMPTGIDAILAHEKRFLAACKNEPNRIWRFSSFREFYPADDFGWLSPKPEIMDRIESFRGLTKVCAIGMHVRRGDHVQAMRCSPLHLFYDKIAEEVNLNPDVRVFLCTDDPDVKKTLCELYPNNIVTRKSVLSRHESGGVADAVVDLWLLSRCQKIYGTYPSSFSLVAAKIGRAEFEWIRDVREKA